MKPDKVAVRFFVSVASTEFCFFSGQVAEIDASLAAALVAAEYAEYVQRPDAAVPAAEEEPVPAAPRRGRPKKPDK